MRRQLWPEWPEDMQTTEMAEIIARPEAKQVFVFQRETSGLGGFIEVFIRERTNGAVSPRVGYIEGWYVDADLRQRGIGGQLLAVAERWLRRQGLTEVASDTDSHEISPSPEAFAPSSQACSSCVSVLRRTSPASDSLFPPTAAATFSVMSSISTSTESCSDSQRISSSRDPARKPSSSASFSGVEICEMQRRVQ